MSNKSGVSSQVISLPQGGGAISGLGESFSPDLHTGTGNFTVPIILPPGRNGFQPKLSLGYSTGNGNGPFGLGWGISVPGISRKTSQGIPHYDDAIDTFLLSGAEDLVLVERDASVNRYRPRTEGLFARIEHHQDADNNFWQVWSKDGLLSFYGTPRPADADDTWEDPAILRNPQNPDQVFSWQLSLTLDPFDNRIEYVYERDRVAAGLRHWEQLYLQQIRYGDYTAKTGETQFLVSVNFDHEDRPDPFSTYRSGFEIRTRQRCYQITTHTHADTDRHVKTQALIYFDQRAKKADQLPLNGVSLLSQVWLMGHNGEVTESMPPLEFDYSQFAPQDRQFKPLQGRDLPTQSLAHPNLELADLFGNGLPDFLEMGDTVRYWRNLGNGRFAGPKQMTTAPAGVRLSDPGVQLLDADGDGRVDLLITNGQMAGYFPLRSQGGWDSQHFQRYDQAPSINLEDPEVKLVDLNGDGVTDALRSGTQLEHYFNTPREGWNLTRFVERQALQTFPNVNFSDPRVRLGDLSGDGLQDIVLIHDGLIEYWPNLGHGNWGSRIAMTNSPRFRYGYDPSRILVGDVDGDGLDDMVYVDDRKVILWINQNGNGWSDPIEIKGTPAVTDVDAVRLVDLMGNGIPGILWSADATGRAPHLYFLDLTGGVKPYLLNRMENQMGAVTEISYVSSIQSYLEAEAHPDTRWKTTLPFPVQVVVNVTVSDLIAGGRLTTEYRYHHGYWDGAEREFRGFGRVEQFDTERFDISQADELTFSPPTLTKTWFHQGPVGPEFGDWRELTFADEYWPEDPQVLTRPQAAADLLLSLPRRVQRDAIRTLRGQVLRTELYALDGSERQDRPFTVTESLLSVSALPLGQPLPAEPADWQLRVFFPHGIAQRTSQWERGEEPMTQFSFASDFDGYGQARSQLSVAIPRGRDYRIANPNAEPYLATQTLIDYAQRDSEATFIVDRVARTTQSEILNDGSQPLFELVADFVAGETENQVIAQTLTYYDGEPFEGLPLGELGKFGAAVRAETLVLTEAILATAYDKVPPYLSPSETDWTEDYPTDFQTDFPELAGYRFYPGDDHHERGYFVTSSQQRYDFQGSDKGRGLVLATRDPLNYETQIGYDAYQVLPSEVIDAVGIKAKATHNYRVMQPETLIDANGNITHQGYSPLGLVVSTAALGKADQAVGDRVDIPSQQFTYDFFAFSERQQPVSIRIQQREHHVHDTDVPLPQRDAVIEMVKYCDGFGRSLQTRTQTEDITFGEETFGADILPANQHDEAGTKASIVGLQRPVEAPANVIVSGWKIYSNKGHVIQQYESFYSTGFDYSPPVEAQLGQSSRSFYDPRGQVLRTINPDGSEQQIVLGIPIDLADPNQFVPTPWIRYIYDSNDNAGRTHSDTAQTFATHWNTPVSLEVDALGRTIKAIERNGPNPETDWYPIESTYDIRGNLLTITDGLGRLACRRFYDLSPGEDGAQVLRVESLDAGTRLVVFNAAGNALEHRDSKGSIVLQRHDRLHRLTYRWARDSQTLPVTLRERLEYSNEATPEALAQNRLGNLHRHYDEAGVIRYDTYDFKGNPLEQVRQMLRDQLFTQGLELRSDNTWEIPHFQVNWQPPEGTSFDDYAQELLDQREYRTSMTYDALNRVKQMRYPQAVTGNRKTLLPEYNRAGKLTRVVLDSTPFVEHIAYDAKGRRTLIIYGNGVLTRYAYNPQTFRLVRLRTERYTLAAPLLYQPTGAPLQDLAYKYDLTGNLVQIVDQTPGSGVPNNPQAGANPALARQLAAGEALIRQFDYDPLYRLQTATGRESDRPQLSPLGDNSLRSNDLTRTRLYRETYQYDAVGNLKTLKHQAESGGFVRQLTLVEGKNRLATMRQSDLTHQYDYDTCGNLIRENSSRHFGWDHSNQLKSFCIQTASSEPSLCAYYLYDTSGQRVKKWVRKQGGQIEVTVYIDQIFEHHRVEQGTKVHENNTLHVMDDQSRIALVRVGPAFPDDQTPAVKYHLGDHLDSSTVVLDDGGNLINREEYTPYGETSFGSFARKRYRFTGKERDEESGLHYHGARYYTPTLARWVSADPIGLQGGLNLYRYAANNPLAFIDSTGLQNEPASAASAPSTSGTASDSIGSLPYPTTTMCTPGGGCETVPYVGHETIYIEGKRISLANPITRIGRNSRPEYFVCDGHGCRWMVEDVYWSNVRVQGDLAKDPKFFKRLEGVENGIYIVAGFEATVLLGGIAIAEIGAATLAKEIANELVSDLSGGLTDYVSLRKAFTRGAKTALRYADRDILVAPTRHGPQAFYRSTGHNSGMGNSWLPFDGIDPVPQPGGVLQWFNKARFTDPDATPLGDLVRKGEPLHRIGPYEVESFVLRLMDIGPGKNATPTEVNRYLQSQGAYRNLYKLLRDRGLSL
ncbi:MAG: SpvB/TcaC N-terminal domain-containing protein [Cyanobacteria bacterium J06639_16]